MIGVLKKLWERVLGSYRSTLVGLGAGIAVLALDSFSDYLNGLPQGWAKALAALLVLVGGLLKDKSAPPAVNAP